MSRNRSTRATQTAVLVAALWFVAVLVVAVYLASHTGPAIVIVLLPLAAPGVLLLIWALVGEDRWGSH